jgi:hypothetical protein
MDGNEWQIDQEWLVLRLRLTRELRGPVDEQVGGIPFARSDFGRVRRQHPSIEIEVLRILRFLVRKVNLADRRDEGAVEAALPGADAVRDAKMPFAGNAGVIAGRAEYLGKCHHPILQLPMNTARAWNDKVFEMAEPRLVRIGAGQQRRARRAAPRGVVELREPEPAGRQRIDVGCRYLASVATDIGESHVIDEDDHDVRPCGAALGGIRPSRARQRCRRQQQRCISSECQEVAAAGGHGAVILWKRFLTRRPVAGAPYAAKADMAGRAIDGLRMARGRAVALAVIWGAKMRSTLDHFPADARGLAPIDTFPKAAAARIGNRAARPLAAVRALAAGKDIPVVGPLPDIADHVE